MPRTYQHPYSRKAQPDRLTRSALPAWLQKPIGDYDNKNTRRGYVYWKLLYWATPPWLDDSQVKRMRMIWQSTKPGQHVDHEVPISSPIVCGLNVPWNLRVIDGRENMVKGNSYWPDMPFQPKDLFDEHRYEDFLLQMTPGGEHGRAA